jgi:hypothetical protein
MCSAHVSKIRPAGTANLNVCAGPFPVPTDRSASNIPEVGRLSNRCRAAVPDANRRAPAVAEQYKEGAIAKYQIILSSSLYGELARRAAGSRREAFATAAQLLVDRAIAEAKHDAATMHNETIGVRIERGDSPP